MNLFHNNRASLVLIIDLESQTFLSVFKDHYSFNIPGGKCFRNETDIDCAIREIEEETGLFLFENKMKLILSEQCEDFIVSTFLTYDFVGKIHSDEDHLISFLSLDKLLINKNPKWIKYHRKLLKIIKK
jgi:8-oxo-dGTP pyrophosphatase MutT (NUDIX family)